MKTKQREINGKQCEGSVRSFLTIGTGYTRCENNATATVTQDSDGDTMVLCTECSIAFKTLNPQGYTYETKKESCELRERRRDSKNK